MICARLASAPQLDGQVHGQGGCEHLSMNQPTGVVLADISDEIFLHPLRIRSADPLLRISKATEEQGLRQVPDLVPRKVFVGKKRVRLTRTGRRISRGFNVSG